jgi:hypothetical protein
MKLRGINAAEEIIKQAHNIIAMADKLKVLSETDLPGEFIFSPPFSSRLCVRTLAELHEARAKLKVLFGWKDMIENKFFSCGDVIVTFRPTEDVKLPIPFALWVEGPPETFPKELLGDCRLVPAQNNEVNYNIVCPIPAS